MCDCSALLCLYCITICPTFDVVQISTSQQECVVVAQDGIYLHRIQSFHSDCSYGRGQVVLLSVYISVHVCHILCEISRFVMWLCPLLMSSCQVVLLVFWLNGNIFGCMNEIALY